MPSPANLTTLQETTKSPIDGTEYVRLATTGANWKATLQNIVDALATLPTDPTFTSVTVTTTVTVTGAVTAARFILSASGINTQTGTSYSLLSTDNGKVITLNNANPITLTCPAGLGAAFACTIIQLGAGQVAVVAGGGATVSGFGGATHLAGQFAMGNIIAPTANSFVLGGNIT